MCRQRLSPRLYCMSNDYTIALLAQQRQQDFADEAAQDRLARLATADRTPWWSRLVHAVRPRPARTARPRGAHRVAH